MKFKSIFLRSISVLSVFIIFVSSLAVPSYATSADDSSFFDVLDFGTANGSGYQYVTGSFPMQVVYQTVAESFRYIDMLVTSDCGDLTVNYAGTDLTSVLISSDGVYRYRFYGSLVGDSSGYLAFTLNGSSGSTVIFESMKVSQYTYDMAYIPSIGSIVASPYQYNPSETMSAPNSPVFITLKQESAVNFYKDYFSVIHLNNWNEFDYLDVIYRSRCGTIDNIQVDLGTLDVPHTISYIDSSLAPDTSWDDSQMYGDMKTFDVLIHLDFTNINRDYPYVCEITINGQYAPYWSNQYCMLSSVTGVIASDPISPLGVFWHRIQGFFVALFSDLKTHLTSLLQPDQEQQDAIDKAESEMDELDDLIDSVPDTDFDSVLPEDSFWSELDFDPLTEFFRSITENPVIYNSIRLALSLALISFLWRR